MSTKNTSKHFQQPIGIMVIVAVCGIILASGYVKAADTTSSEAAIAEMKEMFGGVPAELQLYPESARAAAAQSCG